MSLHAALVFSHASFVVVHSASFRSLCVVLCAVIDDITNVWNCITDLSLIMALFMLRFHRAQCPNTIFVQASDWRCVIKHHDE